MRRFSITIMIAALLVGCSDSPAEQGSQSQAAGQQETPAQPAPTGSLQESPASSANRQLLFDSKRIAGKTEAEVTALLGKPIQTETGEWMLFSTEQNTPYVKNDYAISAGTLGVMFLEGKAAQITLDLADTTSFEYPGDVMKVMDASGLTVDPAMTPEGEGLDSVEYINVDGFYLVQITSASPDKPDVIQEIKLITEERYQ